MDYNKRHPLEAITNSKSLSLLEALIPFVDYPLKLPLALLIKYYEISRILQAFQSLDNLSRCGLHKKNSDPMDMLCAITGIPPEILKMAASFSNSQGSSNPMDLMAMLGNKTGMDAQALSSLFANFSNNQSAPFPSSEQTENGMAGQSDIGSHASSFEENIQSIFSEYDLMQAAQYNHEFDSGENAEACPPFPLNENPDSGRPKESKGDFI